MEPLRRRSRSHGKGCAWDSPKEDSPKKDSSALSLSEEELPTDEVLHNEARQKAWLLDMHFNAWHHEKIANNMAT